MDRRSFLGLAAVTAAASVAGTFLDPGPVSAAAGGKMLLGSANSAGSATTTVATTGGTGLAGKGAAHGVYGVSNNTGASYAGAKGTAGSTASYGVMSSGKLGVNGPVELAAISVTSYTGPGTGKSFLYVKTTTTGMDLRFKTPTGDVSVAAG